jgi:hypothetical protein
VDRGVSTDDASPVDIMETPSIIKSAPLRKVWRVMAHPF